MLIRTKQFLAPPIFEDDEKTRIAGLLNIILLAVIAGAAIYTMILPVIAPNQLYRLLLVSTVFPLVLSLRHLMRRGQVRQAAMLLVSLLWLIMTVSALTSGGLESLGFNIYIIIILMAGLLLGGWVGIGFAGLSIVAGLAMFYAEIAGLLRSPATSPPPGFTWMLQTLSFLMAAVLLYLATSSLNRALDQARHHERALADSNRELQARTDKLERQEAALHKVNRAYKVLSECNQAMIRATEETALLHEVCHILVDIGGYTLAWVGFAEHDNAKRVRPVTQAGDEAGYLDTLRITWSDTEQGRGPTGTAIRTGKPVINKNANSNPDYAIWRDEAGRRGYISSIALPLIDKGPAFGALNVYAAEPDAFDPEEVSLLIELTGDLAFGIVTLRARAARRQAQEELKQRNRELTALKEALAGERHLLRTLIDNVPDYIYFKDTRSRFITGNQAVARVMGAQTADKLIGKTDFDFYPQELAAEYYADEQEIVRSGQALIDKEEPLIDPVGNKRWLLTTKVPLQNDQGKITGIVGIGRDVTEHKRVEEEKSKLFREVSQQREHLRALTRQLAETQETERKALARELHDRVGQNLTALNLNLNVVKAQLAQTLPKLPSPTQVLLDDSLTVIEQTTASIHDVMADLRPPVLDDYGLVAALRWYSVEYASRVSFAITVHGEEPDPRLDNSVELALFRITQEALTNVAKHAHASQVKIIVQTDPDTLRLLIQDDGVGFEPAGQTEPTERSGWGLLTMAERAEVVAGRCRVVSRPGHGARVIVEVSR